MPWDTTSKARQRRKGSLRASPGVDSLLSPEHLPRRARYAASKVTGAQTHSKQFCMNSGPFAMCSWKMEIENHDCGKKVNCRRAELILKPATYFVSAILTSITLK